MPHLRRPLGILFALLAFAELAAAQAPTFSTRTTALPDLGSPLIPSHLEIGDVNGDGRPDLVIGGRTAASPGLLIVLLGDGGGGFVSPTVTTFPTALSGLALGDLDHDGKLDAAIGFDPVTSAGTLGVYLGDGAAHFALASTTALAGRPRAVRVGTVNGDAHLDIVAVVTTTDVSSGSAQLFLGDGVGGLAAPATITSATGEIAIADLNNDGQLDLAVGGDGTLSVKTLLGDGLGSFGAPHGISLTAAPLALTVGDVNGDGAKDLALTTTFTSFVTVVRGDGLGGFAAPLTYASASSMTSLAIADFNLDGLADLAGRVGSATVTILPGVVGGGLGSASNYAVGLLPRAAQAADFDGDLRPDVATVNLFTTDVTVLLNRTPVAGVASYGTGTPGCTGIETLDASPSPRVNTPHFAILCDHAPPATAGLLMVANAQDLAGTDYFGVGVAFHLDLFTATEFFTADIFSNSYGDALAPLSIPNNPAFAGALYYLQALWLWPGTGCSPSSLNLSSSRGLSILVDVALP